MYERIGVNHFHCRCGARQHALIGIEQCAGGKYQQRPNPLAAIQHRVAHRLMQAGRRGFGWRQKGRERLFHLYLNRLHPDIELLR